MTGSLKHNLAELAEEVRVVGHRRPAVGPDDAAAPDERQPHGGTAVHTTFPGGVTGSGQPPNVDIRSATHHVPH